MNKKNILSNKEANKIYEKIREKAVPSKRLEKYVHDVLLEDSHFLFQYKEGKKRFGYCTYCQKDFPLEIEDKRTYSDNDLDVLYAKHNEKVFCPCCGRVVTKRYGGISRPVIHADVAEFKTDKDGALIVYAYYFTYDYKNDFHIKKPHWHCYQIGYFDIHRYFHIVHGYFEDYVYLGVRYTSQVGCFTNRQTVKDPRSTSQNIYEGIKCFELEKALLKSNLKYSCLMEYMGRESVVDMYGYLKFYCSYPEITEKLMKEGYQSVIGNYLCGGMKGVFNFRATTVSGFLKLDKRHIKYLKELNKQIYKSDIMAMQIVKKNNIKFSKENFSFLTDHWCDFKLIDLMLNFVGIQKLRTYAKRQGEFCACRYSFQNGEYMFFENYRDYIAQCKKLSYDLTDKNIVMPANVFQAHQELTDLLNRKAAEEKARENAKKMKRFSKRLSKLQKKYSYTDGTFLIRPAEDYEDLCKEGTVLHHCVYSNYADDYIKGKTDILFIRRVSEPDSPYYTMEYKNDTVIQCRGLRNCSTTAEIRAFIENWKTYMKNNLKKKEEAA